MSSATSDIPLPDPDRVQQAAQAWMTRFKERRGYYTALGIGAVIVLVAVLVFLNLGDTDAPSAFAPLWTKCEAVTGKLDANVSAAAEIAQLEGYLEQIRGTPQEGLALWFLSIYRYREAWTEEKFASASRQPHLERALAYLEELKGERFDDLLVAKSRWFVAEAQSPIDKLTVQVKSDLAWVEQNDRKPPQPAGDPVAVLRTSEGDIHIQFYTDVAPGLADNFLTLCRKGTYNGTLFHFVNGGPDEPRGLMGGDPYTFFYPDPLKKEHILRWGAGGVGYDLPPGKAREQIYHGPGIVTSQMRGRSEWNNGVQFQIMLAADQRLDRLHTPFGLVVEGMDVVRKCAAKKTASQHAPYENDSSFSGVGARYLVVEPAVLHKAIVYESRKAVEHSFDLADSEQSLDTLKSASGAPLPEDQIYGGRRLRRIDEEGDPRRGLDFPFPEDAAKDASPLGERTSGN